MEKVEREEEGGGGVEGTVRGQGEKERGKYWGMHTSVCVCLS